MFQQIRIEFLPDAESFLDGLEEDVREQFFLAFRKTAIGEKGSWFKKLKNTDDLWEFRVNTSNPKEWYRLIAFYDKSQKSLIVTTHGFKKKTNETPKQEIKKGEKIKNNYGKK